MAFEIKMAKPLAVLPPAPDKCQMCAVEHAPDEPHNRDSLFYGVRFLLAHGREPTWSDALAHISPVWRARWQAALTAMGGWKDLPDGVAPIAEPGGVEASDARP